MAVFSLLHFVAPLPALLCNRDGTELYLVGVRPEYERLACEQLKGLEKMTY